MRIVNGIDYEKDPEKDCYRDAICELKKGNTTYVYNKRVLNKILEKLPNVKVNKREFFWEVRNDI